MSGTRGAGRSPCITCKLWKADPDLALPFVPDYADPVWHLFAVRHPDRDRLQEFLGDAGIGP